MQFTLYINVCILYINIGLSIYEIKYLSANRKQRINRYSIFYPLLQYNSLLSLYKWMANLCVYLCVKSIILRRVSFYSNSHAITDRMTTYFLRESLHSKCSYLLPYSVKLNIACTKCCLSLPRTAWTSCIFLQGLITACRGRATKSGDRALKITVVV